MPFAPSSDAPGAVDGGYRRLTHLLHQTILIDYLGGTNPRYVGWAEPGADTAEGRAKNIWRIAFLTYDGNNNVTKVQWANGTIAYAASWDQRANPAIITYS